MKNRMQGDKGEMMTSLLDSTDSDVEWLSLPPIKGKKMKKKKSSSKPRDTSVCDTWVLLKVFLCVCLVGAVVLLTITTVWLSTQLNNVRQRLKEGSIDQDQRDPGICSACTTITLILVLLCMLVCAGLIWMHLELKADLENMKMNLKAVESQSSVNGEDVMKLQGFVIHINKSLELETKTSQQLLENITAINGTIFKLSDSLKKVSAAVEAAPEIKQIPEKLKIVSQTLATMGSDVTSLKEKVESIDPFHKSTVAKLENLTKQIEEIKQELTTESESSEELNPDLANLVQMLPQKLEDLNSTVSGQISVIMKSLNTYEERFVKLENTTHSSPKITPGDKPEMPSSGAEDDLTSEQFKTAVSDIVQDMLSKMSTNGSQPVPVLPHSQLTDLTVNITDLKQRIVNLEKLQSGGDKQPSTLSQDSFSDLKDTLEGQLQAVNESLVDVKTNQAHVASIVLNHSNMLTNISHQVKILQHYVSYLEQAVQTIHAANITATTSGEQPSTLAPSTTQAPDEEPSKASSTQSTTQKEVTSTVASTGEVKKTTIIIHGINNAEELKNGFNHWSRGGSVQQVPYDDLPGFLGPYTPDQKDLDRFDEDKSGSYSLQEFSKALGIPLEDDESDLPKTTTEESIPPR